MCEKEWVETEAPDAGLFGEDSGAAPARTRAARMDLDSAQPCLLPVYLYLSGLVRDSSTSAPCPTIVFADIR